MPITVETLNQCLWARAEKSAVAMISHWRKGQPPMPAVRAIFAEREHNFRPIFCLPASFSLPLLRSRLALPRKYKETLLVNVVQVQISECAPVAVYGETTLLLSAQGYSYNFLKPSEIGVVKAPPLLEVAQAIQKYLHGAGVELLSPTAVTQPVPEVMQAWNRKTVLDVLFMKDDYVY